MADSFSSLCDSWEMATIGHPLSDVCNFLTAFYTSRQQGDSPYNGKGFLPGETPGLPQAEEIVGWYREISGYDPEPELNWGMSFSLWKLAGVLQGIAARYAVRQASSEKAQKHAMMRGSLADFAWALAQDAKASSSSRL